VAQLWPFLPALRFDRAYQRLPTLVLTWALLTYLSYIMMVAGSSVSAAVTASSIVALCHMRRVACTRAWFPCEHLPWPHPFFGWLRRQREKSGGGMLCSLEKLRCDLLLRTTLRIEDCGRGANLDRL